MMLKEVCPNCGVGHGDNICPKRLSAFASLTALKKEHTRVIEYALKVGISQEDIYDALND